MPAAHAANFRHLCFEILSLDKVIRFVCIAMMEGQIIATQYRDGTMPLLSKEESELSIMQALIRWNTRKTMEHKLGRPLFSLTEYEKILGTSMVIYDSSNKLGLGTEFLIVVSIEKTAFDPTVIIKEKILPYVQRKLHS